MNVHSIRHTHVSQQVIACLALCTFILFSLMQPAVAQDQEPVSSKLEAFIVSETRNGNERFTKANRVTPGELIEYRISYRNNTSDPLGAFTVNGDVPSRTVYVAQSQQADLPAVFQAEVADLGWVDVPAFREITNQDGTIEKVQVSPDEYQNLRWRLAESLPPDREVNVTYRIRVDQ